MRARLERKHSGRGTMANIKRYLELAQRLVPHAEPAPGAINCPGRTNALLQGPDFGRASALRGAVLGERARRTTRSEKNLTCLNHHGNDSRNPPTHVRVCGNPYSVKRPRVQPPGGIRGPDCSFAAERRSMDHGKRPRQPQARGAPDA